MSATKSMYHSSSGVQSPHSTHIVGVGKSGADFIHAILRTGSIEDSLEDPRSRFTALAIDIGEQDILRTMDHYNDFLQRLTERGIPTDRVQLRTVALPVPERNELFATLQRYREFLKREYPRYYWNPNFDPWIPADIQMPKAGESFPRGLAKAIYGKAYYDDKILDKELTDFADSVRESYLPPLVYLAFSFAGGTGSGMVVDLARHLANVKLGRGIPVCGLGFLPCEGDPEEKRGANLYPALNEIDLMVDENKNKGVTAVWGDLYANPFTGGFMMVPLQPAWERLSYYASTAKAGTPHKMKVTTKFVDDCLARFITADEGRVFFKSMRPLGLMAAPHEFVPRNEKCFTVFSANKFLHPAVAVLPGEGAGLFRSEISKWVDKMPDLIPLKQGFHTDYMECHVSAPRGIWTQQLDAQLGEKMTRYVDGGADNIGIYHEEMFDVLTSFADVVVPGVSKTDLSFFTDIRDKYEKIEDDTQKLLMHSFLLDVGVLVSEPSIRFEGQAGECIWGCACWIAVPYDVVTGRAAEAPDRATILKAGIAPLAATKAATPK